MKIIQLKAENIKGIKAVDITPKDSIVKIEGKNGAGKSSVLDSILWGLAGANKIDDKPIRDGEKSAEITINVGEYLVQRTFTGNGTRLYVTSSEGVLRKPQHVLNEILGDISLDPLAFFGLSPKEQIKKICSIDGAAQFDLIDEKLNDCRAQMTNLRAEKRVHESMLGELQAYDEVEPVNIVDLAKELEQARQYNNKTDSLRSDQRAQSALVAKLQSELEQAKEYLKTITEELESRVDIDTGDMAQKIQDANDINNKAQSNARRKQYKDELEQVNKSIDEQKHRVKVLHQSKVDYLEFVRLPDERMSIDPEKNIFTLNGIPIGQISLSEKIILGMKIAMMANPDLRVIRIMDGSLMDSDNLSLIASIADENDYQVWIESVEDAPTNGFYIDEGYLNDE